jgi:hypothetical protein
MDQRYPSSPTDLDLGYSPLFLMKCDTWKRFLSFKV